MMFVNASVIGQRRRKAEISCEGAGNIVYMWIAIRDGTNPEVPPVVYMDGQVLDQNNMPPFLSVDYPTSAPIPLVPIGFYLHDVIQSLTNNDTENHRFKADNTNDMLVLCTGNTTVVNAPDYSTVQWCLGAGDGGISCENAIDMCTTGGIWGSPTMTVNGVEYNGVDTIPDVVEVWKDGELTWNYYNLTDDYLRIELKSDATLDEGDQGFIFDFNPTRTVDYDNKVVTFCLAPFVPSTNYIEVGTLKDSSQVTVYCDNTEVGVDTSFFFRDGGAAQELQYQDVLVNALRSDGTLAPDIGGGIYPEATRAWFYNQSLIARYIRIETIDAEDVDQNHTPENESFRVNTVAGRLVTNFKLAGKPIT